MRAIHRREDQPWLRYLLLPITLILFGLIVSYTVLANQKQSGILVPPISLTPTPTPTPPPDYACPTTAWIDCMPGPDRPLSYQCQQEFINWATDNCPGFEGVAY